MITVSIEPYEYCISQGISPRDAAILVKLAKKIADDAHCNNDFDERMRNENLVLLSMVRAFPQDYRMAFK